MQCDAAFISLNFKVKIRVKVAGFRPGSRHPLDWPLKRMQKPA